MRLHIASLKANVLINIKIMVVLKDDQFLVEISSNAQRRGQLWKMCGLKNTFNWMHWIFSRSYGANIFEVYVGSFALCWQIERFFLGETPCEVFSDVALRSLWFPAVSRSTCWPYVKGTEVNSVMCKITQMAMLWVRRKPIPKCPDEQPTAEWPSHLDFPYIYSVLRLYCIFTLVFLAWYSVYIFLFLHFRFLS